MSHAEITLKSGATVAVDVSAWETVLDSLTRLREFKWENMHEVDDTDAAQLMATRARQFEQEALDAPPAAFGVTDDALVLIMSFVGATAAATLLARAGMPVRQAEAHAKKVWGRALADPLHREELLQGARHVIAGRCSCGEGDVGHDPHNGGGGS